MSNFLPKPGTIVVHPSFLERAELALRPLYHGGQRGIARDALLLPPSQSSARNTLAEYAERISGKPWDREHVYLTTDFDAALFYAVLHPSGGWVYECEPLGDVSDDPDCTTPGLSCRCLRARVLKITIPNKWQRRDVLRAAAAMEVR